MSANSIQCPGCGSAYEVPPILFEKDELRVCCPACRKRFTLRRAPAPPRAEAEAAKAAESQEILASEAEPALAAQRLSRRAKRISRALVSQILRGRQARRDRALAEGRLILEFGPEIQKIWRIYEEKVGPEFARGSAYFREALNEILAKGNDIF